MVPRSHEVQICEAVVNCTTIQTITSIVCCIVVKCDAHPLFKATDMCEIRSNWLKEAGWHSIQSNVAEHKWHHLLFLHGCYETWCEWYCLCKQVKCRQTSKLLHSWLGFLQRGCLLGQGCCLQVKGQCCCFGKVAIFKGNPIHRKYIQCCSNKSALFVSKKWDVIEWTIVKGEFKLGRDMGDVP